MVRSSPNLALLSGFLGAFASCLAKLAFHSEPYASKWVGQCHNYQLIVPWDSRDSAIWTQSIGTCLLAELLPRVIFLFSMIASNVFMLGLFLEGMEESGSVAGTALSSAANFGASAMLGYVLWHERFPFQWWIGFTLVIIGVILLSSVKLEERQKSTKQDWWVWCFYNYQPLVSRGYELKCN